MKKIYLSFALLFIVLIAAVFFAVKKYISVHHKNEMKEAENEDYFFMQHSYPYGKIDYDAQRTAARDFKNAMNSRLANTNTVSWQFAGPVNIGGRITDIEMDPTNQQVAYLASASGGVFKTTNGGTTWSPVFDSQPTLSIGDIAIAPSNTNIIYVGTGEANGGSGSLTYDANGIYKSTNGGATWSNVGLQNTHMTGRMAVHPTNPDIAFAACMGDLYGTGPNRGLYKTIDGGVTWTKVLFVNDSTGAIDVVINPSNPNIVFAATWERTRYVNYKDYAGAGSGVWKSVNGGTTWTRLDASNGLPPVGTEYSRIGIDLCASNPNIVYCMYLNNTYDFQGIYKSTNDGANWTQTNDAILSGAFGSGQGYWYGRVKCDPVNPDIVFVIGFDIYETNDGGVSYFQNFAGGMHVDQHIVAVHPLNDNFVMCGNDGGLHISNDGGFTWFHHDSLPISQVYRLDIDFQNPSNLYCGLQDNGTVRTLTGAVNDYNWIFGGDGFQPLVDPTNNQTIFSEYQYGNFAKSLDGGANFTNYPNGIFGSANWNSPLVFDPQNPMVMYMGAQRVFKSSDEGDNWIDISPDLTTISTVNLLFGTITYISVSSLNSDIIYAGTDDGKVWNTLNGGTTWTDITGTLPQRWVTCVETDKFNQATAYVTLSGYRFHDAMNHVYKTINNGLTWTDIGSNLPNIPCNSIKADPINQNVLYIATDVGVYYTLNGGTSWTPVSSGMPVVVCTDLKIHQPTHTLVAGTYGRGLYKINLSQLLGTEEKTNIVDFSVFPNPASDKLIIKGLSQKNNNKEIKVYDNKGREVIYTSASSNVKVDYKGINISSLSKGIYFIKYGGGVKKFVKD